MSTLRHRLINRRRLVASSFASGAATLTIAQASLAGPRAHLPANALKQDKSSDVPMPSGNPARNGEMPGPGPNDTNGVEVFWSFTTSNQYVIESPAVVDGVVYAGTNRHMLYAFDANDGSERWRIATDAWSIGAPAVVNGSVYAGSTTETDSGAMLYAFDANNGSERWRFTTSAAWIYDPVVVDGIVYVGSNDFGGAMLYAVNADDGSERWRFAATDDAIGTPAVVEGIVYTVDDGVLYALHADDGSELWRSAMSVTSIRASAVVDSTIYTVSSEGDDAMVMVYAFHADDGRERWRFATAGMWISPRRWSMAPSTSGSKTRSTRCW